MTTRSPAVNQQTRIVNGRTYTGGQVAMRQSPQARARTRRPWRARPPGRGRGSRGRLNDGPIFPDLARPRILDGPNQVWSCTGNWD